MTASSENPRPPTDIVADILDFPLDKPPSEPFDRSKSYSDQNRFGNELRSYVDPVDTGTPDDSPDGITRNSSIHYEKLLKALEHIRNTNAAPEDRQQLTALTQYRRALESMAVDYDYMAGESKKPTDTASAKGWAQAEFDSALGRNPENERYQHAQKDRGISNFVSLSILARNIRQEVMPLFQELNVALGIGRGRIV